MTGVILSSPWPQVLSGIGIAAAVAFLALLCAQLVLQSASGSDRRLGPVRRARLPLAGAFAVTALIRLVLVITGNY